MCPKEQIICICMMKRHPNFFIIASFSWICRLLVGAPEADARQPGVHKGGAVYKCSATNPGDCNIIPFDMKGETWI